MNPTAEYHPMERQTHKNITVCSHPPCSDMAPCDFWIFPKVKIISIGKCFELIQNTEATTTAPLKIQGDLQNCFRNSTNCGMSVFEVKNILKGD